MKMSPVGLGSSMAALCVVSNTGLGAVGSKQVRTSVCWVRRQAVDAKSRTLQNNLIRVLLFCFVFLFSMTADILL